MVGQEGDLLCPCLMMVDSLYLHSDWVFFLLAKQCYSAPLQQSLLCRALTPRVAMSSCETWNPS